MKGSYKIKLSDRNNKFEFILKRNITILRGNSGTGKTTLFEMIDAYYRDGKKSGVSLSCDVDIATIRKSKNWDEDIKRIKKSIVVIDEDGGFITSEEFASIVKNTDNYYLLITRNYLKQLPYSVDEIYEIEGDKNKRFINIYKNTNNIYSDIVKFIPEIIITEDSNAGFQFFDKIKNENIVCVSGEGKSNIINIVKNYKYKKILIIADGAAFGNEIENLIILSKDKRYNIALFLPESFEWLILKSGIIEKKEIKELKNSANYIDSKIYFSWEQFFNYLLIEKTKNNIYCKYNKKRKLPHFYFQEKNIKAIINLFKNIIIQ